MNKNKEQQVVGVPVPAVLKVERASRYGSVPGLDDEELADPAELERQVTLELWGPILALPDQSRRGGICPVIDEFGHLDWGPFGTVDFERLHGGFNKAMYKADKLREELRWAVIMLDMAMGRVPGRAKYMVLKHLDMGIIDFDHIVSEDMRAIVRRHVQAKRLQEEIRELLDYSRGKRLAEDQ